jgi:hypothetical protein
MDDPRYHQLSPRSKIDLDCGIDWPSFAYSISSAYELEYDPAMTVAPARYDAEMTPFQKDAASIELTKHAKELEARDKASEAAHLSMFPNAGPILPDKTHILIDASEDSGERKTVWLSCGSFHGDESVRIARHVSFGEGECEDIRQRLKKGNTDSSPSQSGVATPAANNLTL